MRKPLQKRHRAYSRAISTKFFSFEPLLAAATIAAAAPWECPIATRNTFPITSHSLKHAVCDARILGHDRGALAMYCASNVRIFSAANARCNIDECPIGRSSRSALVSRQSRSHESELAIVLTAEKIFEWSFTVATLMSP